MSRSTGLRIVIGLATLLVPAPVVLGQPPGVPAGGKEVAVRPRSPTGLFNEQLGLYVTIEGTRAEGGKYETDTLLVDTVNGKRLDKPLLLLIRNLRLPRRERCILKGYELGEMIGRPPAEYSAAEERGEDVEELVKRDATVWHWRPYFIVLRVVAPEGLEIIKKLCSDPGA